MALAVITSDDAPGFPAYLDQLQFEQFEHDEIYHREITRLPLQQRLRHMALHFAKYSGNLAVAQAQRDGGEIQRVVTDVFIIGMSAANALNFRLTAEYADRRTFGCPPLTEAEFATTLVIGAGRMAAASEKLDHMEDFAFRQEMRRAAADLVQAAIGFANANGWDLNVFVKRRLKPIKEKFIYHGRL
jgi:hypothetical protein